MIEKKRTRMYNWLINGESMEHAIADFGLVPRSKCFRGSSQSSENPLNNSTLNWILNVYMTCTHHDIHYPYVPLNIKLNFQRAAKWFQNSIWSSVKIVVSLSPIRFDLLYVLWYKVKLICFHIVNPGANSYIQLEQFDSVSLCFVTAKFQFMFWFYATWHTYLCAMRI